MELYPHILPTVSSEILYTSGFGSRNLLNNNGTLMRNSTHILRLTLSQYGKAFGLSATPVSH